MVKTVQIRNVPDDVHRTLRGRAAAAGMSLSDYLLSEIAYLAERPTAAEVFARGDARRGGATDPALLSTIIDEIRQRA